MDRCPNCGARLQPDMGWCGRCLAPVPVSDPELQQDARPLWARSQLQDRGPDHVPTYSRVRAGPTSFGIVGRSVLTVLLLLAAVIGEPLARGFVLAAVGFDVPGAGFIVLYGVFALAIVVYALTRIWRRSRVA